MAEPQERFPPGRPNNRRKFEIIVVGTGLAGGSAAATLGELGYNVKCFCYQDSPRRAHSIAAQGGINAAKNYQNDGDSVFRLFYDTIKGGDFRSREANVYRLAEVSNLHHRSMRRAGRAFCARIWRPARQSLLRRRPGFANLLCPRTDRPATVARRLSGTLPANRGRHGEDVSADRDARPRPGRWPRQGHHHAQPDHRRNRRHFAADAVVLATGGYGNVFYLSTNARGCNVTATYRAYKKGALFANPCFTQIHPTCIPVSGDHQSKLTLMSESLRNDGRVWVPKTEGRLRQTA